MTSAHLSFSVFLKALFEGWVLLQIPYIELNLQNCLSTDKTGPMHEEKKWETPQKYHLPRSGFITKSENQYFSTFQIPLEPCCQHGSNGT